MKRVFSLLMVCVMLFAAVSVFALALNSNGFVYEVVDGEAIVTAYTDSSSSIVIPDTLGGYPVTKIGDCAFADRAGKGADISSLTLPKYLREIGDGAFSVNSTVTTLTIPAGVESIGNRAFHCWIKLNSVQFSGGNLKSIGNYAFRNCHSLVSVSLPKSIETIGVGAFSYCISLSSVDLPESLMELGREAFLGCTSLSAASVYNEDLIIGEDAFDLTAINSSDNRTLVMTGYNHSTAQTFANAEGFSFNALPDPTPDDPTPGDPISTSGDYCVRVTYSITGHNPLKKSYAGFNSEQNDSGGISLLYKEKNGTASDYKTVNWDIGSTMTNSGTGTYTLTCAIDGFPYLLYAYIDDNLAGGSGAFNVNKLEVGNSFDNLTTVWTGKINVASSIYAYAASVDWDNTAKVNYFHTHNNTNVSNSSGKWEKPYAKNMRAVYENENVSLLAGENEVSNAFTYAAADQYGVNLDASLCSVSSSSSVAASNGYISTNASGGNGNTACQKQAHLSEEDANSQTISTVFNWQCKDRADTHTAQFTLEDEKYPIRYQNDEGEVIKTLEVYYGDMPTFAVPNKESDKNYHYAGGYWTPDLTAVSGEKTYDAVYTQGEHTFTLYDEYSSDPTCDQDGANVYYCTVCGYVKADTIPASGHKMSTIVHQPTCSKEGYTVYSCDICLATYIDDYVPALGHDFSLKDINEFSLRTTANAHKNATYYYTCSRCDEISRREDLFFEEISSSISGVVDMTNQFKPITVVLMKDNEEVERCEVKTDSNGEFCFYWLEPAEYSIVLQGEGTTIATFNEVDLTDGEKLDLKKSEDAQVSLIEVTNGDVNSDGVVDLSDITAMLSEDVFGKATSENKKFDINNDGVVNVTDISIALQMNNYGSTSKQLNV